MFRKSNELTSTEQRDSAVAAGALYTDAQLLERAARAAMPFYTSRPQWAHIGAAFNVGQTTARALCHRFGLDPDLMQRPFPTGRR